MKEREDKEHSVPIKKFPPVEQADSDGLLAIGGDLTPQSLLLAYTNGIFPWPFDARVLSWFAPPERAILFFDEFHLSRRTRELLKKNPFRLGINERFSEVIRACAESPHRKNQVGTWITEEIIAAYIELHQRGFCLSFEAYEGDTLVGGLYGVRLGGFFAAESSFYRTSGASKAAMNFMVDTLRREGLRWVDCQVLSPFSQSFGAREVPRIEFMRLLSAALEDT
jgi:leucyl/phenylalanyl-tRNA--protein transferase